MSVNVRAIEYFTATAQGAPECAYELLGLLAKSDVNLLGFTAIPFGLRATQLVLFPEDPERLRYVAREQRLELVGPDRALFIQGDDELGALARIHRDLTLAGVCPYASSGLTDGRGGFGYIVNVRKEDFDTAAHALGL